jgi:HlyD family secretion protein
MMQKNFLILTSAIALAACAPADDSNRVVGELASDRIELTAEFSEAIVEILVAEGDAVSKDQVLLRQNDARAISRMVDAEAAYQQMKARLDELVRGPRSEKIVAARATVEGATQELEFRLSEQARIVEIHQRGLASPDLLDRANAALDSAQASLKLQLAQLEELLAGTTIEELAQAEQALKQAGARRDSAQIDIDRHALSAPVDGVVDSRLFEMGERPGAGQPVIVVLAAAQPHARVYVPEAFRVQIRPGTKALIYVDGLDAPVAGQVRWIASESAFTPYYALTERDRGRLSYVAKVDILDERDRLPDGVPVEVEFELN